MALLAYSLEMALLYFCTPLLIVLGLLPLRATMPILFGAATVVALIVALRHVRNSQLGFGETGHRNFRACVGIGLLVWAVAQLFAAGYRLANGDHVFPTLMESPLFFGVLVCCYAGSVIAQEFVFRAFFFWRYASLAPRWVLLLVNVAAFGWVHYVFGSWISVAVAAAGGVIFSGLFIRYRSFWGVCLVHAAFGLSVFAMGYGRYFISGGWRLTSQLHGGG